MVNDAAYKALRDEILEHARWWILNLGLDHWQWHLRYDRHPAADDPETYRTNAMVMADAARMTFDVTFFLPSIAQTVDEMAAGDPDRRDRELERIIVHELAHVLVAEMRPLEGGSERDAEEFEQHEERAVSQITLALMWAANNGRKRPRIRNRKSRRRESRAA